MKSSFILLIIFCIPFFLGTGISKKEDIKDCENCSNLVWERSTIYLDSLKKEVVKKTKKNVFEKDSLEVLCVKKDKIIFKQKKIINNLAKEIKAKEQVIIEDTIKKRSFFQKIGLKK